jgi:hypothetical protein
VQNQPTHFIVAQQTQQACLPPEAGQPDGEVGLRPTPAQLELPGEAQRLGRGG